MDKLLLKEDRVHGDVSFPLGSYYMEIPSGSVVLDCHWHEEMELLLVTSGKAQFRIEAEYYEVHQGECIFVNSGELHAGFQIDKSPCSYKALVFSPSLLYSSSFDLTRTNYVDPIMKNSLIVKRHITASPGWQSELLGRLEMLLRYLDARPPAYELLVKSELFGIFALLSANCISSANTPERSQDHFRLEKLKTALKYIQDNYSKKISTFDIAASVDMSEGHFCRLFKHYVKKTPVEYLNYYRITRAARLLEETGMKVLEVAMEVGFDNLSYFIGTFKRHMGMTPSKYRSLRGKAML
ncbi:MAG TPA: AraC family transcriptional regulator [Clostridiales bacterium]|nr:AraC family transcriptional regulator [Clostridiales bacterium]HOL90668.1 AraC family transcriptional regulator [Clostridiales bacterium]